MTDTATFGEFETAWCPGCGNFSILKALKQALAAMDKKPHEVLMCSGIGQAAKTPHYLKCNVFNGLHGRGLPAAQGAKLANRNLLVFNESGDGCNYGEGGNHFLAALRRNVNLTLLAHDNQIYGLTKGQASPTTAEGQQTKAQPMGVFNEPFKPLAVAVALKASFVARGFSGDVDQLAGLIRQAAEHEGFAMVDILQPCVSFNKVNTFKWYKDRVYTLPKNYNPENWDKAMAKAMEFGDKIPTGVIYKNPKKSLDARIPWLEGDTPLCRQETDMSAVKDIMMGYA